MALLGCTFAGLSDSLYCSIAKSNVTVSLKSWTGYYRCSDSILNVEKLILSSAKDLMTIQSYINKRQDVDYRTEVKQAKIVVFNQLQLIRTNLKASIKTFEDNVFQKMIQLFVAKITPYKQNLQKSLVKFNALTGTVNPVLQNYRGLLSWQVEVIDKISKVTTQTELIPLLNGYIYFKTQLAWKFE